MRRHFYFLILPLFLFIQVCLAKEEPKSSLMVYLFASSTCEECTELKKQVIPRVLEKYGNAVGFRHIAVDEEEAFKLQLLYEKKYGVSSDDAVKLFAGESCLWGAATIRENLDAVIAKALRRKERTPTPEEIVAENKAALPGKTVIARRFSALSPMVVAAAGLIDGINPCAFVTIVFFISLLSMLKKTKKEILLVGTAFSGSVFITYLLLGIGVLKAVKVVSVNSGVAGAIIFITGIFALALGVYSLLDFMNMRTGKKVFLKLPRVMRNRINLLLSSGMRQEHIMITAFGLGVVISLLESMCTGQVYLPTVIYMLHDNRLKLNAFSYLLVYNVMFIVPLLVVFACAYAGISSRLMSGFLTKNARLIKLLMSLLFFAIGVVLLLSF